MMVAAQQRNVNEVAELLKYEIDLPPPALVKPKTGDVHFADKSKLVAELVKTVSSNSQDNRAIFPSIAHAVIVKTLIIDASVMIKKNRPQKTCKSFSDYGDVLKKKLEDDLHKF